MSSSRSWALGCLLLPLLAACGSNADESKPNTEPKNTVPEGPAYGEWQELITSDWTMAPGDEGYFCARKTVDRDMYVTSFEAINPFGTHHTLLTVGEPQDEKPDGIEPCGAGTNRTQSLFGSGVGTDTLYFPEGTAIRVPKGQQLLLNLHLYNATEADIDGLSGTRIVEIPEADVGELAEGILAGTVAIQLPPNETTVTTGYCTMSQDFTIIAVAPHMHQLGIYERVVAEPASKEPVTIHDEPYSFDEQSYKLIEPLDLSKGDRVRVECTHRNTTNKMVTFGESSFAEMCFAGLYRVPAVGSTFGCIDFDRAE
jgi:hypothetical protein